MKDYDTRRSLGVKRVIREPTCRLSGMQIALNYAKYGRSRFTNEGGLVALLNVTVETSFVRDPYGVRNLSFHTFHIFHFI